MEEISRVIARFLFERGIDRLYGLCGGHIQPIWDHAAQLGIRIIDVRDERAAVHMAQAHSELTGHVGVAIVTAGPGMTNAITGIANAHVSRTAVLILSGTAPRPQQYMGALQDLPQTEMIQPITRYARTITCQRHVLKELDEAMTCALGHFGEPGPAFIDFPTDLLRERISPAFLEQDRFRPREAPLILPSPESVEAAVQLLWAARRLLVISGRGARGAGESLRRLLEVLGCVYVDTTESRGLIPRDHAAFMPAARGRAMQEADVVLTVGRSLDYQLAYGSRAVFKNVRFVRMGTSLSEVRGNRPGDVEIFGSVSHGIEAIIRAADKKPPAIDRTWVNEMRALDRKRREELQREWRVAAPGADGAMHPCRLLSCIQEVLSSDAVVVADGGDILSFSRVALTDHTYLDCGPFGCLGVGVPYGIAASLLYPARQVWVISGDGAFGFNAIELDTCRRHHAKVVFVVANNAAWNIERYDQKISYEGRLVGVELEACDYAGFARSLGLYSERVVNPHELPNALRRVLDQAPALLDVLVTRYAVSPDALSGLPKVPDYQALEKWNKLEQERIVGSK